MTEIDDVPVRVEPAGSAEPGKTTEPPARPRRAAKIAGVGLAALAVAGTAAAAYAYADRAGTSDTPDTLPPAKAEVTRGTLTDEVTEGGTLGYGALVPIASRKPGTVTALPEEGEVVRRGEPLFEVDATPVPLVYGTVPAWRDLASGAEGTDVKQLEKNLWELGYRGFDIDHDYTDATAAAVAEWQEDLGVEETGTVRTNDVVVQPTAVRIGSLTASLGDQAGNGGPVLSVTDTVPSVTVTLDPADRRMAEVGAAVEVTLPDGTAAAGKITDATTKVSEDSGSGGDGEATTTLEVVAVLTEKKGREAAAAYDAAAVDVTFTAGERKDVLTVPVAALVALAEGGFGVEVVDGSTTEYVPVETGLFSGGRVEISGEGVTEGTVVGVPGE
ncbi:peptidoglycan-binding protein [Nocardioides sp. KC13]|uniref:Peptidoglycan-binding protein n=1 Tax=Nocardioides turkmenicus TaxID=2711220 RepID=A0A6M1RA56_9ACTN|nr:peptidoglycan-binding protein [Nocardioides sp. KC13]